MADAETRDALPPTTRFHATRGILLTQAVRLIVRLGTAAGLARLLRPEDYGVFAMAALVHGFVYVVQDFGLSAMTLRKPSLNPEERNALFWLNAVGGLVLALLVAALGQPLAAFYQEPLLKKVIPALASTFILTGLYAQLRAQLGREQRFDELNRIEIVAFIVSAIAALLAAGFGAGCWALVILVLSADATLAIGIWRAQTWRPGRWPRGFSPWAAFAFGAGVSGHQVVLYLQRNLDQFLAGRWFGAGPLGLYGRGAQLVAVPGQYLTDPLAASAVATLGRLHDSPAELRAYWSRLVNGLVHLTLPLAVLLFCVPSEILRLFFGRGWEQGAPFLQGLSASLLSHPVMTAEVWLLIALGRTRRLLVWSLATLALAIVGYFWAGTGGAVGLAWAVSLVSLGGAAGGILFALRGLPVTGIDVMRATGRPLILAAGATLVVETFLILVPMRGAVAPLAAGAGLIAAVWMLARRFWPGVRLELSRHFLSGHP